MLQFQMSSGAWVDVGYLHHADNRNWFEFRESYWRLGDRPVLGQIFEKHRREWRPSARVALPHWFSHPLPEGRFRSAVAAAAHSHRVNERPGFSGVPEAELACLTLASRAGIDTADGELVSPHDVKGLEDWARRSTGMALAVERFDRRDDDVRIHMEELAQVMDIPTAVEGAKYTRANFETIGVLVAGLCGVDAVAAVIDRIVLNVLVGNGDAHLKNWAVRYVDGRTPVLSPLYDVVPTVLYLPGDDLGLNLARSKSFDDVVPESFDRLGERTGFGVSEARQRVRDAAERITDQWRVLTDYLDADAYRRLSARRDELPLLS